MRGFRAGERRDVPYTSDLATLLAAQQTPPPAGKTDHVAAVKQSLGKSMAALRQYQWVETTVVSMKGEEKSRAQNNCFYGADGKVQKTPIAAVPESEGKAPRGLRGKAVENKKEEISDSTKKAIALVNQYLPPPDPARIHAAKDAVGLNVAFGAFADGTVYPDTINLDVKSQNLGVVITNSRYKKVGG